MLNDGYWDMCVAMVTRRGETFCGSQQSWKAYIVQLTVIWLKHENTLRSKTYLIIIAEILDFFPILQTLISLSDLLILIFFNKISQTWFLSER